MHKFEDFNFLDHDNLYHPDLEKIVISKCIYCKNSFEGRMIRKVCFQCCYIPEDLAIDLMGWEKYLGHWIEIPEKLKNKDTSFIDYEMLEKSDFKYLITEWDPLTNPKHLNIVKEKFFNENYPKKEGSSIFRKGDRSLFIDMIVFLLFKTESSRNINDTPDTFLENRYFSLLFDVGPWHFARAILDFINKVNYFETK